MMMIMMREKQTQFRRNEKSPLQFKDYNANEKAKL